MTEQQKNMINKIKIKAFCLLRFIEKILALKALSN